MVMKAGIRNSYSYLWYHKKASSNLYCFLYNSNFKILVSLLLVYRMNDKLHKPSVVKPIKNKSAQIL